AAALEIVDMGDHGLEAGLLQRLAHELQDLWIGIENGDDPGFLVQRIPPLLRSKLRSVCAGGKPARSPCREAVCAGEDQTEFAALGPAQPRTHRAALNLGGA